MRKGIVELDLEPVDGKWCPSFPREPGCYLNEFPLSSGKTTRTKEAIKGSTAIIVTPGRALSRNVAKSYGVRDYTLVPGKIGLKEGSVSVCLPSLLRLDIAGICEFLNAGNSYSLVLDEADQLFDQMHSTTIMKDVEGRSTVKRVEASLSFLIRHASMIYINDAYISDRVAREVYRLGLTLDVTRIRPVESHKPLLGSREYVARSEGHAFFLAYESLKAGNKQVVSCDTRAAVVAYAMVARSLGKDVLEIHGDSDQIERDRLLLPTEEIAKVDVIVHNQAAGSGVSWEMEGFESFIIASNHIGTHGPQLRQLAARLRYPKDKARTSFVRAVNRDQDTCLASIFRSEMKREEMSENIITYELGEDGAFYTRISDEGIVRSRSDSIWYKNVHSNDTRGFYYGTLEKEGCEIIDVPADDDELKVYDEAWGEIQKASKAGEIERIKSAVDFCRDRALAVSHMSSSKDRLSAEKYFHKERFGEEGMADEVVSQRKIRWRQVKRLSHAGLVSSGRGKVVAKRERNKASVGNSGRYESFMLSSETLEATFIYRVLAMAGFEGKVDYYTRHQMLDVRFGSYLFNDSHLEEIKRMDAECSFKSLLGLKSPDSVDKISRFVCQVLGLLGLEVKRTTVTINGKKHHANMIEPKSHALMMAISDRYYRKCLDLPVPSIEPEDGMARDLAIDSTKYEGVVGDNGIEAATFDATSYDNGAKAGNLMEIEDDIEGFDDSDYMECAS